MSKFSDPLLFTAAGLVALYILRPTFSSDISGVLVGGILTLIASRLKTAWEVESNVQLRIREKKSEVYEEFLVVWFDGLLKLTRQNRELKRQKSGNNLPSDVEANLNRVTAKLIPWASTKVIRQYAAFRMIHSSNPGQPGEDVLFKFEDLMRAMREDIGQSNDDLKEGDLLRLFLTDVDKFLKRTPDPIN